MLNPPRLASALVAAAAFVAMCLGAGHAHATAPPSDRATLDLPDGLSQGDAVALEFGVSYLGAVVPERVQHGTPLTIELYFLAPEPFPPDTYNFLHVESIETSCRFVMDRPPRRGDGGLVRHRVDIGVPEGGDCRAADRLEIYTGLYNRESGARFEVIDPPALGDRIYAGFVHLSPDPVEAPAPRALTPSDMRSEETSALMRPWRGTLLGILGLLALALLLRGLVRGAGGSLAHPGVRLPGDRRRRRLLLLASVAIVAIPLLASLLAALDFMKDDAYISFRYAENAAAGRGLVFNTGEYVEGFTNFLWTIVMIPFAAMGLDLLQVSEVFGFGLVFGLAWYMVRVHVLINGARGDMAHLWGAVWLVTCSSVALWSTSGMEQAPAMFLPVASAFLLWRVWGARPEDRPDDPARAGEVDPDAAGPKRLAWIAATSGALMGLGCLTRPEIHLIGVIIGLPLVWRAIARRRVDRVTTFWFVGLFAVTVPAHLFRYLYYGSLLPNTFFVKTGESSLVMVTGLEKLREMFGFNGISYLVLAAPLAFLDRRRLTEKLVMAAIALSFMGYIIKVGPDEMRWHRLYLPALPFLVMLAGLGLHNLARAVVALAREDPRARVGTYVATAILALSAAGANFAFTYDEMGGFNGRGGISGEHHPDLGKYLVRHDHPGALAAFQDMGSTPYHAPDIKFLDFIGLVDETVARARHSYGLHAFLPQGHKNQPIFDAEMRDYFYERDPEWAILTTYIGEGQAQSVAERFARDPTPASLGQAARDNGYQFGIYDESFERRYAHVRTWERSQGYYLSLFRRRDLWEQIPGEVVLDAPPADMGGVSASFERGLELLGSHFEPTAKARHEVMLTTWWRVPGPMEPDVWFFTHIEREDLRHPYDSLPGDFMYPADRWRAGDIVEHRTLVQLPPSVRPGSYEVRLGVYRRSTGERFAITEGGGDGDRRILLGELTVEPLRPPFDHLVKPTDVDFQRKYPERIIDSGREDADAERPGASD